MGNNNTATFEQAKGLKETDSALLVQFDTGDEHWIPKSQIHDNSEVWREGDEGELVLTEWIAKEKGLI